MSIAKTTEQSPQRGKGGLCGVVTNLGEVPGISATLYILKGIHFYFSLSFFSFTISFWLFLVFSLNLSLSETQDDLEAITNEIKKAANNGRNKLKSQDPVYPYCCIIKACCVPKTRLSLHKMFCFFSCMQVLSVSWSQTQTKEPQPIYGYVNHRSEILLQSFLALFCVVTSSSKKSCYIKSDYLMT